jgi:2-dehydro-3-deoxyphosphogluconate aldolase / (4S)-4-hydroxy-2-oxoglutarate aldolase
MTSVSPIAEAQIVRRLDAGRVIATAAFDHRDQVAGAGAALIRGGVSCLEIPFSSPSATAAAIRAARGVAGLLVGVGNVLEPEQAAIAERAGAQFATAPGTNMAVVHACRELQLPFFPGIATPSELERLQAVGVSTMSVFPVAAIGGPPLLEALAETYPAASLIPRGGVRPEVLGRYGSAPTVLAVVCPWIVRSDHVRTQSFDRTQRLAVEARASVSGSRGRVYSYSSG